jgi:hypothetical protein
MIAITVGAQRADPPVRRKAVGGETGIERRAHPLGTEGSELQLDIASSIPACHGHRFKVDRPRVGRRPRRAGADAALHLHALHIGQQIGEVREIEDLVLHVVERDAVDRDVDPRLVEPTQTEIAVPPLRPGFGVGDEGGGRVHQQHGHILPDVTLRDDGTANGLLRDGGFAAGTNRLDEHPLDRPSGIGGGPERIRGTRHRTLHRTLGGQHWRDDEAEECGSRHWATDPPEARTARRRTLRH